tara:strand:- start:3851 stop:4015 length:165 start_codon:yes stop_codon:yes gene_type:complete
MEFLFTVLAWAVFSVAGFFFLQANPRLKEKVRDKLHIFLLFTLLVVIFVRLIFF